MGQEKQQNSPSKPPTPTSKPDSAQDSAANEDNQTFGQWLRSLGRIDRLEVLQPPGPRPKPLRG